jgi:hypothetical protein
MSSNFQASLKKKTPYTSTQGQVYDLQEIFDRLNSLYFNDRIVAELAWMDPTRPKVDRKTFIFARYCPVNLRIVVNRKLDHPRIPSYCIEQVMHHEMLHQKHGGVRINNRTYFHTRAFRAEERRYEKFALAESFQNSYLPTLLDDWT